MPALVLVDAATRAATCGYAPAEDMTAELTPADAYKVAPAFVENQFGEGASTLRTARVGDLIFYCVWGRSSDVAAIVGNVQIPKRFAEGVSLFIIGARRASAQELKELRLDRLERGKPDCRATASASEHGGQTTK